MSNTIGSRLLLTRRYRADLGYRRRRRFNVLCVRRILLDGSSFVRFRSCFVTTCGGYADVFCSVTTHWLCSKPNNENATIVDAAHVGMTPSSPTIRDFVGEQEMIWMGKTIT